MPDGARWERFAARWLQARGLLPMARNVRSRWGEIDLIMRDGDTLVFVEVRYRRHPDRGGAWGAIGPRKRQRLRHTAADWLADQPALASLGCRFDALILTGDAAQPDCRWIRQAFTD